MQPSISSVTAALESAIQRLKKKEFLSPETCHEIIKKMYTWQDIARRTEIVYDERTLAGHELRRRQEAQRRRQEGQSVCVEENESSENVDSEMTLRWRRTSNTQGQGDGPYEVQTKDVDDEIERNEYGVLMENLRNCYSCGPFVGKFLVVAVLLDYLYLKILDWVYPVELIDIAPDVS